MYVENVSGTASLSYALFAEGWLSWPLISVVARETIVQYSHWSVRRPRGLPCLPMVRKVAERQRERRRETCICEYRYIIYIYIYIWMPFVNISILMIWGTEFSAYFSLDVQLIARRESDSKKEREKRGKSRKGRMDGWRAFIFPGISSFFQKWHIVRENRVESAMHARTISERKRRYFTEKCDNEPATGLPTRVISEMMLRAGFSIHLRRQWKARCSILKITNQNG